MGFVVDMEYVSSDKLGNLVRHGFVLDVQFTYVVVRGQFNMSPYF